MEHAEVLAQTADVVGADFCGVLLQKFECVGQKRFLSHFTGRLSRFFFLYAFGDNRFSLGFGVGRRDVGLVVSGCGLGGSFHCRGVDSGSGCGCRGVVQVLCIKLFAGFGAGILHLHKCVIDNY